MKRALSAGAALIGLAVVSAGLYILLFPSSPGFGISSGILGEKRRILVALPDGYDSSNRSYPVLIHLDADPRPSTYGPSLYGVAKKLNSSGSNLPGIIVLGITNTHRNRDMIPVRLPDFPGSGGARAFLRFITDELVPRVESRYRISDVRILYGRSDSGLFALYALTEAPAAIRYVIASSPTVGLCPSLMGENVSRLFRDCPDFAGTLFIIYGANEGHFVLGHVSRLADEIRQKAPDVFRLGVKSVPGGGHVPENSLEAGLRFIFSERAQTPD